ncbi:MAG: asparagine synthase (glutamine-hydrolyzing) [Pseudomonadales bacterium]
MCGIFGISYKNNATVAKDELLRQTASMLSHRGPDFSGIYAQEGIALVHTRLSLIDMNPRSNQPFWDATGRYALVYNGEIYNFRNIRAKLSSAGVIFTTDSDTEVLLHALIHRGVAVLEDLEGMFAFGFYDRNDNSLVIARDRFGIKPLYYQSTEEAFAFASEQSVLTKWIKPELDYFSISSYLQGSGGPHLSRTLYNGLHSLPPGTWAKVRDGNVDKPQSFFKLTEFWLQDYHDELNSYSDKRIVDTMDELLFKSVEKHLLADAPVGALCSGGVDSSLILSMAAKIKGDLKIFHADVVGRNSEKEAAVLLSQHLNLELSSVSVSDADFVEGIPRVTKHYGQPFIYHPNSIPFLAVTDLVREHNVKAILTGEAADECYLGYSYLPTEDILNKYHGLLSGIGGFINRIPNLGRLLFPGHINDNSLVMNFHNRFEQQFEEFSNREDLATRTGIGEKDYKTIRLLGYHLRSLLHRNDSLGMASSIEARFPFLDHDLVNFSVNLPYRFKIRKSLSGMKEKKHPFIVNKWVLRQVADRYLPRTLSRRPKQGFPTDAFERMEISDSLFQDSFVSELFGLTKKEVSFLGEINTRDFKLRLMLLDVWGRMNFRDESVDEVSALLMSKIKL